MFDIKRVEEVVSTNATLWEMIKDGKYREGTVILSGFQHQGKGQKGNSWHSEKDQNLLASLFLKPDFLEIDKHFYLSKIISLAIVDVLKQFNIQAFIKWPNDILVGERKICGILIENALEGKAIKHTVAGIGINVNQRTFPDDLSQVTSVINEINREIDIRVLLDDLLEKTEHYYSTLKKQSFDELDELYRNQLFGYQRWLTYQDEQGIFQGQITAIEPDGALGIHKENGQHKYYYFKEVEWLKS